MQPVALVYQEPEIDPFHMERLPESASLPSPTQEQSEIASFHQAQVFHNSVTVTMAVLANVPEHDASLILQPISLPIRFISLR